MKQKQDKIYSMKKYILFTLLCTCSIFLLTAWLLICMNLHYYVKTDAIPQAVESVMLENIKIQNPDGEEVSLAQYILDEYIQDDRISVEEVQEILHNGTFTDFAAALTEQYNQYLAKGGEFPEIDAQEFVSALEQNADIIYDKTGLRFLDPDKKKLKENLDHPLTLVNNTLESYMYKGVKGFFLRLSLAFPTQIVLVLLLAAALIWLILIHIRSMKKIGRAFKLCSIAASVPCFVLFLTGLLMSKILNLIHLPAELSTALRGQTVHFSGVGLLICILLFLIGILWNLVTFKPELAPPEQSTQSVDMPKPIASPAVSRRQFCRFCGEKLINPDAQFCYQCGKVQNQTKIKPTRNLP